MHSKHNLSILSMVMITMMTLRVLPCQWAGHPLRWSPHFWPRRSDLSLRWENDFNHKKTEDEINQNPKKLRQDEKIKTSTKRNKTTQVVKKLRREAKFKKQNLPRLSTEHLNLAVFPKSTVTCARTINDDTKHKKGEVCDWLCLSMLLWVAAHCKISLKEFSGIVNHYDSSSRLPLSHRHHWSEVVQWERFLSYPGPPPLPQPHNPPEPQVSFLCVACR